ncbi:MAG: hypothetical protein QOI95_17 [Acidimicrobiaceae bacterium]|jgi:hypothetical protein
MAGDLTAAWFGLAGTVAGSTVTYFAQERARTQEWKLKLREDRRAAYADYLRKIRPLQLELDQIQNWTMEEGGVLSALPSDTPEYARVSVERAARRADIVAQVDSLSEFTNDLGLVAPPTVMGIAWQIYGHFLNVQQALDRWIRNGVLEDEDMTVLLKGQPASVLRALSDSLHEDLEKPWTKPTLRRRVLFRFGR